MTYPSEPTTYTGAPDECSIHWPVKNPCAICARQFDGGDQLQEDTS